MLLATEINLFPDKTLFAQLGIFLILLFALNRLVFQPVLRILKLRRAKTDGDRIKIEETLSKTAALVTEYEEKIKKAKKEAFQIKEGIRKEGEAQGLKIVQESRRASQTQIEKIKSEIARAGEKAGKELQEQALVLSNQIAEKLMGRSLRN